MKTYGFLPRILYAKYAIQGSNDTNINEPQIPETVSPQVNIPTTTQASITAPITSYTDGICNLPDNINLPFCNSSLSIDDRVQDLISRIPDDQAIGLMVNNATSAPKVGIPAYQWWNEGLHGVARSYGVKFEGETPYATSFPQVISTSASFNRTLFRIIGETISTEARGFYNSNTAGLTFWTPNINIFRDPRWGRGQETPGEDPLLNSEYAVAFVRAFQGDSPEENPNSIDTDPSSLLETKGEEEDGDKNPTFLKASACCKHFSAYSQEFDRHSLDAIVTVQDQEDTYFPAFEACVERGHVSSVMCSYNAVNGIPSCADKNLLTGVIREKWGFDGYITSDCEALADVQLNHHYTQSTEATCATTLNAGVDQNCGEYWSSYLAGAMSSGHVTRDMVDTALMNQFRVLMRLGMFEQGTQPYADLTYKDVDTPEHRALALEAGHQSIVLLKNDENILPLQVGDYGAENKSLALIGPHINTTQDFLGNYFGIPYHISTPLEAITDLIPTAVSALGCEVAGEDNLDIDAAVSVAANSSQVVLFVGLNLSQEREDWDRSDLEFSGHQIELIDKVANATDKPVILVLISGGAVNLKDYKNDPRIGAIVFAGYLGQSTGQAIADVLFGVYNPSGRLTQTFYDGEFTKQVSLYDMHMRPFPPTGNPGRTYRFFTGEPVYEFGYGLSYTSFETNWQNSGKPSFVSEDYLSLMQESHHKKKHHKHKHHHKKKHHKHDEDEEEEHKHEHDEDEEEHHKHHKKHHGNHHGKKHKPEHKEQEHKTHGHEDNEHKEREDEEHEKKHKEHDEPDEEREKKHKEHDEPDEEHKNNHTESHKKENNRWHEWEAKHGEHPHYSSMHGEEYGGDESDHDSKKKEHDKEKNKKHNDNEDQEDKDHEESSKKKTSKSHHNDEKKGADVKSSSKKHKKSSKANSCMVAEKLTVTNTGTIDGDHTILVFAIPPDAGVNGRPLKSLVAFDKVYVEADTSTDWSLCLSEKAFTLADESGEWEIVKGKWTLDVDGEQHDVEVGEVDVVAYHEEL